MNAQIIGLIRTLRIRQWDKNAFVFVPLIFDHKLFIPAHLTNAILGFFLLCLISSTVYIMNDLADVESDRAHPTKRNRPIAAGQLSKGVAIAAAIALPVIAIPLAYLVKPAFAAILLAYLIMQVAYSFKLKHVVLIDVLILAAGFVLRVAAGVVLVDALRFSPWLYLFTTMLALFIGFGKRRQELALLEGKATNSRSILSQYTIGLLDVMIVIVSATTLLTYALYTFSADNLPPDHAMMLTIPFVLYIIFRYLYLIHVRGEGGAPEEVILTDRPLQLAVVLGGITIVIILYFIK